jgi:type VI secretion system protein
VVASDAMQAFLRGAGMAGQAVTPEQAERLLEMVGAIFRQVVEGLREVLLARASLKSGFRMELTMIRPTENNPLKFSAGGVEEAMENLLFRHGRSYLPPQQAFREGFQDIKDHQLAMVAGMQAAFAELLRRFDPAALEASLQGGKQGWPWGAAGRKARCWDSYEERYRRVREEAQEDFQRVFGEEFARGYDQQVRTLAAARLGAAPPGSDQT